MRASGRVLAVIEEVVAGPRAPTHAELMRATGISRSTLADLRRLGYLTLVEGRPYTPGPRLVGLVHRAVSRDAQLHAGLQPVLARIAAETGETAA